MKAKNPAAVALGQMRSAKKTASARVNGRKGGRPRKPVQPPSTAAPRRDLASEFERALKRFTSEK